MFALICIGLLLLSEIWRGTLPAAAFIAIIGFLGMPLRYHTFASFQHVKVITLDGLLAVTIALLMSALCFRDVLKIIRKLRVILHES